MSERKRIELTKLQGGIAIASFASGVLIAATCLFIVPPPGEITNSAISIVSELLVLCGAILGVKASFDARLMRFQDEVRNEIRHPEMIADAEMPDQVGHDGGVVYDGVAGQAGNDGNIRKDEKDQSYE